MKIKIFVGPKEKEYYEKKCALMGWKANEVKTAIVEDVNACFFDMIQYSPNGIEFVETDEDFDQESAEETLAFMAKYIEED